MQNRIQSTLLTFLLTVWCCVAAPAAYASFEKAMEIYSKGQFVEAKNAFEAMSAIGDRASLFNLGVMYFRGEAVEPDPVKAYVFMTIANEGLNDESFSKIAKVIHGRLDENQKSNVGTLYEELYPIYGSENIEDNIFPQLLDDEDCPPELQPLRREPPVYPRSEAMMGSMGIVQAEFTVSPEGYAREIQVRSSTSRAFAKTSLNAIQSYRYNPTPNGVPIIGHRLKIIYQMAMNKGDKVRANPIVKVLNELRTKSENGNVAAQYLYGESINVYRHFQEFIKGVDFQDREANVWFTKSAKAGLVNAQYEVGRNMLEGRGCAVDKVNGFKWIKAAAVGGFSPAQAYLATSEFSNQGVGKLSSRSKISWLRNAAQSDDFAPKALLAWELIATSDESLRNADEALVLVSENSKIYRDDVRILETKAAAFALKGDFKKALKFQKLAFKAAEKRDWVIVRMQERLVAYQSEQAYIGAYY